MPFENGKQRRDFRDALLSAFPQRINLEEMLSFELNKNLHEIATGENHSEVVFKVIQWAESKGRLEELIKAAYNFNPGNPLLKEFCQQYLPTQLVEKPTTSRQIEEEDNLSSETGIDYTRLRNLLKAGEWKEADEETFTIMLRAAGKQTQGYFFPYDIEEFPCTDLRIIDQLWVKYSNGRFGFSVQKRIWESVGKDYKNFGDRVGWRKGMFRKVWLEFYGDFTFSTSAREGHLPVMWGRLGVEWKWAESSWLFSRVQTCKI